ncbi:MAG: hypothetical protein Q9186_006578 [Xanthomendoza sp. 1 TL-2023]
MASSFMDVPHEIATWMDIWGPARAIGIQCMGEGKRLADRMGGIVTNIGQNQKLDLAIYSKRSLFALSRRVRDNPAAAGNVAQTEFLQLLGIVPISRRGHGGLLVEEGGVNGNGNGDGTVGEG